MGHGHIQLRLLQDRNQHSHVCHVHTVIYLGNIYYKIYANERASAQR